MEYEVEIYEMDRLKLGNFGKCDPVGEGIRELKIDFCPGYRVYFGQIGTKCILLLCGGSKKRQSGDIDKAKEYFEDFKNNGGTYGKE